MINYQVFNPLTGTHTKYETEEEAKSALIIIQEEVLSLHGANIVKESINENGDAVWEPTEIHKTLKVS